MGLKPKEEEKKKKKQKQEEEGSVTKKMKKKVGFFFFFFWEYDWVGPVGYLVNNVFWFKNLVGVGFV